VPVTLRLSMARRIVPRHRHHRSEQHGPTECARAHGLARYAIGELVVVVVAEALVIVKADGALVVALFLRGRFSHTTKVHHARVNHPHVHAACYNHGEQGARVSTRRRKGVDAWSTRSGRRPSTDSTTAQTQHELTNTQPKRAVHASTLTEQTHPHTRWL
jgi:hypothetical protein